MQRIRPFFPIHYEHMDILPHDVTFFALIIEIGNGYRMGRSPTASEELHLGR